MRYQTLILLLAAGSANAATLEVSVSQGSSQAERYSYNLSAERQTLDLREPGRYTIAVHDKARKKDICREAEYRTGMVMTLREVAKPAPGQYQVEVVGQVSNLKSIEEKERVSCGTNMVPVITNSAFSDTSLIEVGKPKAMVVDGQTTLVLTIKE
ncbi:hypothetical protein ACI77O_13020 [Pseudomonas tritici]|uniref:hypothetical protein n=1 Tax=Pseudomonas tritici TaxID=2745518 RepID=UPI00387ACF47